MPSPPKNLLLAAVAAVLCWTVGCDPPADVVVRGVTVADLAADGEAAYWTDYKAVWKVPLSGGTPQKLAELSGAHRIAIGSGRVFVSSLGDDDVSALHVIPGDGGPPQLLVSEQRHLRDIAADAEHVYWTHWQGSEKDGGDVSRIAVRGGVPERIAGGRHPDALAVGPDHVAWINEWDETVATVAKSGGEPRDLVQELGIAAGRPLAIDATFVYYGCDGGACKVPLAGGPFSQMPVRVDGCTRGVAIDGRDTFVMSVPCGRGVSQMPATLYRARDDGQVRILTRDRIAAFVITEHLVLAADSRAGEIVRMPKR